MAIVHQVIVCLVNVLMDVSMTFATQTTIAIPDDAPYLSLDVKID